jgi:hypothetical protein
LTARFVVVEFGETGDGTDNIGGLVHDNNSGGSETRLVVLEAIEIHDLVIADVLRKDWSRRATWDDGLEVVPTTTDATAVLLDQLAERDGHLLLNSARVVNVARDTEKLGARVTLTTEAVEPFTTSSNDGWCHSDGLNVCDCAGASKETDSSWERWLQTRLSSLALE